MPSWSRENIVRHVQMGKTLRGGHGRHAGNCTGGAGHHAVHRGGVPADGFMGGIIGKFFHEFGITIVAAVLISMFVSFTLDLYAVQRVARPSIHARPAKVAPSPSTTRPLAASPPGLTTPPTRWPGCTSSCCAGRWRTSWQTCGTGAGHLFVASVFMVPLLGTEFVPRRIL